ncbi:alpha/beta family hydrolase [Microbaculum marinum]|uniref:Alpha/beta family hydrolase n=1 Tax=Microbaculum marinum TaxID=1764581 RepID=A0AAW9RRW9_9HYPH
MTVTADSLLWTRAGDPQATLLLAHGAGAGMTSPFMERIAEGLAALGVSVARFEFAYMAERREGGAKRPPPKAERLIGEYEAALEIACNETGGGPLLIGGKSMGGRVAAMAAADPDVAAAVSGVVCLGYPFHATGNPGQLRLEPLQLADAPVLVCQGDRDPFGSAAEIADYGLPDSVSLLYLEDGDHDFKPRGRSPATWKGNLAIAARAVADFAAAQADGRDGGAGP